MADYVAVANHVVDILLGYLGIHGVHGLEAGLYIVGATVSVGFCAAVPSAFRIAFLRCSARK
ncbi:MAG TPA: hypothetical protein VIN93_14495 [Bryobacteraceae bacterium]